MPTYIYQNPESGEVKEVIQRMTDTHEYYEDGLKWLRVFSVPRMAIDSQVDITNIEGWRKYTNKKGTVGDIMDASAEASSRRAERNGGLDPVKEKFFQDYSKQRKGKLHPEVKMREAKKGLEKIGVEITN
jgi:hypothetical protein